MFKDMTLEQAAIEWRNARNDIRIASEENRIGDAITRLGFAEANLSKAAEGLV